MQKHYDIWLIVSLVGLSIFGAFNMYGIRPDLVSNFIGFIVLGWVVFFITSQLNITLLEQNYRLLYIAFLVLFVLTFIFGDEIRGAKRWINLYLFRFQTSEFFKPVFLITMAAVLSSANRFTRRKMGIVIMLFLIPVTMIFLQPDLGSTLLYTAVFLTMFYFSGLSTAFMFRLGLVGLALLPVGWLLLQDYQKARIIGFMNPAFDPQGLTYNIHQSIISIGSGGFFGKGLGLGTQTRFRFLPEFHTDFAFASAVEQFGFLGGLIILVLFGVIMYRLVKKIFNRRDNEFAYLYLIGLVTILMIEIGVNVGMNLGLMPVTGIALPFISYGGSSIVSTMIMIGIAMFI